MAFNVKKIKNREQLSDIQKLLYDELIIGQNWKVGSQNPTGIKVSRRKLTDNFDSVSHWFAAYSDNTLIACVRIHKSLKGKHELEHYGNIPVFLKNNLQHCLPDIPLAEMSKMPKGA